MEKVNGNEAEVWVDIQGFEGYQVSNLGRVRSLDRILIHEQNGRIVRRKHTGRILSQNDNGHGYLTVQLGRNNRVYVHRLVAQHFVENPDGHEEINHLNADKRDNSACNLQWCNRQENIDHSVEFNLNPKGSKHSACLLNEEQVKATRDLIKNKIMKQVQIARLFGVSTKCISDIKLGYTWKHVL